MVQIRRSSALLIAVVAVIGLGAGACGSTAPDAGGAPGSSAPAGGGADDRSTTTVPPAGTVLAPSADIVVISTPYGDALGTDDGLVLYAWDEEADGTIVCVDAECVETWPPLLATEIGDTADLDRARVTLVERPDGRSQVALDARPLYHMAVDAPGEANCQGTDGWWILRPDGTTNTNVVPRS